MDDRALPLIAQGDGWLAIDKPADAVVVPARGEPPETSLWRTLERQRGERLWVVHRLDRGTSGVLLFARSARAHQALCGAFEHGHVHKRYLAFARGCPEQERLVVDVPLHAARKGKMRPAAPGERGARSARTELRVLARWSTALGVVSLLELRPSTGRQHQLRVHLRYLGCPLLVDPLYGGSEELSEAELLLAPDPQAPGTAEPLLQRPPLHAAAVELSNPDSGAPLHLSAPLAPDLCRLQERLDLAAKADGHELGSQCMSDSPARSATSRSRSLA